jgi:hypothetical protein
MSPTLCSPLALVRSSVRGGLRRSPQRAGHPWVGAPAAARLSMLGPWAALRSGSLAVPRADGAREALRILLVAREEMTVMRTAQTNRLRALLLAGDDTDRRAARSALTQKALTALAGRELPAHATRGSGRAADRNPPSRARTRPSLARAEGEPRPTADHRR